MIAVAIFDIKLGYLLGQVNLFDIGRPVNVSKKSI